MKVVTLNILHGGGKRIPLILDRLKKYNAEVIVLTEFRENKNASTIKEILCSAGWIYQANGFVTGSRINTVFIASRIPFRVIPLPAIPVECRQRALMAKFQKFSLLAVYFAMSYEKEALFNYILEQGIKALGNRGMIIGDFNTGRHFIDESGRTFHCEDIFVKIEESGLVDSWRKRNPDKREFSWYSNKGNGFRIDHVFSTDELYRCIYSTYYDHAPRLEKETDHSALIAELNLYEPGT
ncbi:MAG: endonuclease/exonuclease/phosphatase family protein [archaeon]